MQNVPPPCARQQELIAEVQRHLIHLTELARAEIAIIETGNENAWMEIDKQIENTIGEKERAMGALREHRRIHGC